MDQPAQPELVHQTSGGIMPPRRVPPSLGDEGEQAPLDPAVESVEQGSDIRLPIVVPPAADDRVESLDHHGQAHRCASTCQVTDLLPEPLHRLLTRNGVEVGRVGCGRTLVRREPQALTPLDLVAEELEPVIDMNDPGLLRMEADPERLAQEPVCQGEGSFGLLTGLADDDEVVRPPRQPIAGLGHGTIERREEDVRPQRACDPALRDPRRGRMPFPGLDHSCVKKAPDQVQNTSIADLGRDQAHQLVLVDFVKESADVGIQDPEVAFIDLLPHLPHRHVGRAPRPIPERAVGKVGFEDGSHLLNQRLLNHPIRNRGDSELSEPSVRLWDTDPLHRRGSVAPVAQLPVQRGQAFLLPVGEGGDGEAVDAGPALVVSDVSPGFGQVGRSVDLVDQRMDFPLSWILRSPSVSGRLAGLLDGGAGSFALRTWPHFRHVLTRSSRVDTATQHGAFPLRSTFWLRPASLLVRQRSGAFCSDPVPEYFAPIRLLAPLRSDLRLRLYPPLPLGASDRALRCLFLALSSASVARFRPYLPDGRYQASLGH